MSGSDWAVQPVPVDVVNVVRGEIDELVRRVVASIAGENPVYGEVITGPEGIAIRIGIEQAIRAFLDAIERGDRPGVETGELWRRLGEAEFQAGRSLEALRAAFRTGTRAAWRAAADLAEQAGVPTAMVINLAEAIFVYTDELASDVVEGYLRIQSDEAGELERRRRRLAVLLLDPAGADPEAVARAATLARWPVPRQIAVLALTAPSPVEITRRLGVNPLVGSDAEGVFLIVGDPDGPGQRARIERATVDQVCALGPTVPASEALRSLRWSRYLLRLIDRGAVVSPGMAVVEQHLAEIIVLRDPELAAALVQSRLAAVEALRPHERDRLLETLSAWLGLQRHTPAVAEALHVHPQTVRYRLGKLRELLGETLATADGRFELELALRARRGAASALEGPPGSATPGSATPGSAAS
jgi:PucR-like helix-turn-helix protein